MPATYTRRVVTSKVSTASATGTITFANSDGLYGQDLAAIAVGISGTGKSLTDISAIRVRGTPGEIVNVSIGNYRAWLQANVRGRYAPADADTFFVIHFDDPSREGPNRFRTMFPRNSSIQLELDYISEANVMTIVVTTLHAPGAFQDPTLGKWYRVLRQQNLNIVSANNQSFPLSTRGVLKSLSLATASVTRLELRDKRSDVGQLDDLRVAEAYAFAQEAGGLAATTAFFDRDPDGDLAGTFKAGQDTTEVVIDASGAVTPDLLIEEWVPMP